MHPFSRSVSLWNTHLNVLLFMDHVQVFSFLFFVANLFLRCQVHCHLSKLDANVTALCYMSEELHVCLSAAVCLSFCLGSSCTTLSSTLLTRSFVTYLVEGRMEDEVAAPGWRRDVCVWLAGTHEGPPTPMEKAKKKSVCALVWKISEGSIFSLPLTPLLSNNCTVSPQRQTWWCHQRSEKACSLKHSDTNPLISTRTSKLTQRDTDTNTFY